MLLLPSRIACGDELESSPVCMRMSSGNNEGLCRECRESRRSQGQQQQHDQQLHHGLPGKGRITRIAPCGCGIPGGPLRSRDHDTSGPYSYGLFDGTSFLFCAAGLISCSGRRIVVGPALNEQQLIYLTAADLPQRSQRTRRTARKQRIDSLVVLCELCELCGAHFHSLRHRCTRRASHLAPQHQRRNPARPGIQRAKGPRIPTAVSIQGHEDARMRTERSA
jgi:hypothetical protein